MTYLTGGNQSTIMQDLEQTSRIMRLLAITDRIIKTSEFELKSVIRKQREDLIFSLPAQRVWLFVKHMRTFGQQAWKSTGAKQLGVEGTEDTLVEGEVLFSPRNHADINDQSSYCLRAACLVPIDVQGGRY